jgi:hypothetical protein
MGHPSGPLVDEERMRSRRPFVWMTAGLSALGAAAFAAELPAQLPAQGFEARAVPSALDTPKERKDDVFADALARASVWSEPAVPIAAATLGGSADALPDPAICRFHPGEPSGATPKFDCVFEGGARLKVKYGKNPEIHTEAAATRLLSALGFGADRIDLLRTLRCFGCPEDPGGVSPGAAVDVSKYTDFTIVAVERRLPGLAIGDEGWKWDALDKAQAFGRGAPREQRDALRLMAVLLNNWDNRGDNQRLTCLPEGYPPGKGGHCAKAIAYMHDVGGTFGRVGGDSKDERKLDLPGWNAVPIWKDRATCTVGIKSPRLHGASFGEVQISEAGRRFLAERLTALSAQQVQDLFDGAWFADYADAGPESRDVAGWVAAFQSKVRQIAEGAPCPTR